LPSERDIAERILGKVEWQTETEGLCRCPGEGLHQNRDGKRDCRVSVNGAPTIYCFHQSCAVPVAEANRRLRRECGSLRGGILRLGGAPERKVRKQEDAVVEATKERTAEKRSEILSEYDWPLMEIKESSPVGLCELTGPQQFAAWLGIWEPHSVVWIGDVYSSGKPEHAGHFRTVGEWQKIGPVMGNFTCGSAFRPGSCRRGNDSVSGQRFLVVESDILSKEQVGAVFAWMVERLRIRLHCIIDTAGKSLHGWFDAPRKDIEARLKAALEGLGCDPKVFTYSQPVRVPGALREGKLQELVWLRGK